MILDSNRVNKFVEEKKFHGTLYFSGGTRRIQIVHEQRNQISMILENFGNGLTEQHMSLF